MRDTFAFKKTGKDKRGLSAWPDEYLKLENAFFSLLHFDYRNFNREIEEEKN